MAYVVLMKKKSQIGKEYAIIITEQIVNLRHLKVDIGRVNYSFKCDMKFPSWTLEYAEITITITFLYTVYYERRLKNLIFVTEIQPLRTPVSHPLELVSAIIMNSQGNSIQTSIYAHVGI